MRVSKKELRRIITEELQVVIQEVATQSQTQGQPQSQSEPAFPGAAGIGVTVTEPESKEAVEAEEIATDQQLAQLHGTDPATAAQRNVLNRVRAMLTKKEQALAVAESYSNSSAYKDSVKISKEELRYIIKESINEIHLQEGPIDSLRDLLSYDRLKDIFRRVLQKLGIRDTPDDVQSDAPSEDAPSEDAPSEDAPAGALAGAPPSEGNIDGMSVSDWLANYWSIIGSSGHLSGTALDLAVTDGILSLIKVSMRLASVKAIDETRKPPVKITGGYKESPGNSPNAHYHLRISDDIPASSIRNADKVLENDDWRDYIRVGERVDMDVESSVTDYLRVLASLVKEAMNRHRGRIEKPIVTSANRSPAQQSRVMIHNWYKHGGGAVGTQYLISLYSDDEMATAVGKGLEGSSVSTNKNPSDLKIIRIS